MSPGIKGSERIVTRIVRVAPSSHLVLVTVEHTMQYQTTEYL